MALAAAGPSALWYLTRATGAVTLILMTASMVIGVANIGRLQGTGWPRFVVEAVHRNISLLAIALLVVHIITSVLDPFASIKLVDAVVPFIASYRPIWLGLGAFASDLMIALVVTSVLRRHIGHRVWRATHWAAYLCWPVAVVHTLGTGSDVKQVWLLALTALCVVAVIVSVWVRLGLGWPAHRSIRGTAFAASVALPAALLAWLPGGPLGKDWARRAGTPQSVLARTNPSSTASGSTPTTGMLQAFDAAVSGTVTQSQSTNGLVSVNISLTVQSATLSALAVTINGQPSQGGGVQMTSSSVSAGTPSHPNTYTGLITSLAGTDIDARVASADGHTLSLAMVLNISQLGGAVTGSVSVTPTR